MSAKPILFRPEMVRAILEGRKTMTRRVLKTRVDPGGVIHDGAGGQMDYVAPEEVPERPPYAPGDLIWVREAWRVSAKHDATAPRYLSPRSMTVFFEAGGSIANQAGPNDWRPSDWPAGLQQRPDWVGRYRPGMFLPRWASRITLHVTGVKVERLQDISEEDAVAEGCPGWYSPCHPDVGSTDGRMPHEEFADLWDSLHGPGAWERNDWVAAYTFRPILGNVDTIVKEAA